MRIFTCIICVLHLTYAGAAAGQGRNARTVETEVVGSVNGNQLTVPTDINNSSAVVGFTRNFEGGLFGYDAFLWTRETGFQVIVEEAMALGINNRGDVIGARYECTVFGWGSVCIPRGFVWNSRTGLRDLGDFYPAAINNNGDMAGSCPGGDGGPAACAIYNGVRIEWPCEEVDCGQEATGINERGDVVGWRYDILLGEIAMMFPKGGTPVILGAGTASDINNAGVIGGRAPTALTPSNATLWNGSKVRQLPNEVASVVWGLNSRGWAVGVDFGSATGGNAAFFWDGRSPAVYLAPDDYASEAIAINDRGEIIGTADGGFVIWRVRP